MPIMGTEAQRAPMERAAWVWPAKNSRARAMRTASNPRGSRPILGIWIFLFIAMERRREADASWGKRLLKSRVVDPAATAAGLMSLTRALPLTGIANRAGPSDQGSKHFLEAGAKFMGKFSQRVFAGWRRRAWRN